MIRVGDFVVLDDGVTTGTVTWSAEGMLRVYSPRWYGNNFVYGRPGMGPRGIEYNCHESDVILLAEAA